MGSAVRVVASLRFPCIFHFKNCPSVSSPPLVLDVFLLYHFLHRLTTGSSRPKVIFSSIFLTHLLFQHHHLADLGVSVFIPCLQFFSKEFLKIPLPLTFVMSFKKLLHCGYYLWYNGHYFYAERQSININPRLSI